MDKEKIAHKFFKDIKPKHLKEFEETTPNGNIIKGVICRKPNRFLGSMVLTEIFFKDKNVSVETEQFIQAMPKIHYYDYNRSRFYEEDNIVYHAFEKLDGSCLILYGLYYEEELVEIVPKTRGIPVADKHIIEMYDELDHSNVESFFKQNVSNNPTLLFELYGVLNQHSIFYPSVRIDINLLGMSMNGEFLDWYQLNYFCEQFDFKMPKDLFKIIFIRNIWKIYMTPGMYLHYLVQGLTDEEIDVLFKREYPTQRDVVDALKTMVTTINKNYFQKHNRQLLEGIVLDFYKDDRDETFSYLKIKSADIEEKCRTENGVPRRFILKEVYKYFDEYGSRVKEIYLEDENHYYNYVMRNLSEEFDIVALEQKRTKSRIENVFFDVLEAKQPPKGLQDLCNELKEEFPDESVSDLMRIFAQRYPEKKKYASMAYGIFSSIV